MCAVERSEREARFNQVLELTPTAHHASCLLQED